MGLNTLRIEIDGETHTLKEWCRGYGDDYSFDDDGELVDNCTDCTFNPDREDD